MNEQAYATALHRQRMAGAEAIGTLQAIAERDETPQHTREHAAEIIAEWNAARSAMDAAINAPDQAAV